MRVARQEDTGFGAVAEDFDLATASDSDFGKIAEIVYSEKILILKGQELSPREFVALGQRLGQPEEYYEPMYHHPEEKKVFVSATASDDGTQIGVPRTGKFWHADYQFMPRPFGLVAYPAGRCQDANQRRLLHRHGQGLPEPPRRPEDPSCPAPGPGSALTYSRCDPRTCTGPFAKSWKRSRARRRRRPIPPCSGTRLPVRPFSTTARASPRPWRIPTASHCPIPCCAPGAR